MSGPTIYARLMDAATDAPRQELATNIETWLMSRAHAESHMLSKWLAEHLRAAYRAGIVDGYGQAVAEVERERKPRS